MLTARYTVLVISTMMFAMYFVNEKSTVDNYILLKISFFATLLAFIPLFIMVAIMFVINFSAFLKSKSSSNLINLLFFLGYPLVSMYFFNKWFFKVIL